MLILSASKIRSNLTFRIVYCRLSADLFVSFVVQIPNELLPKMRFSAANEILIIELLFV